MRSPSRLKRLIFKFYRLVNILPFNNSIKAKKAKIKNEGAILYKCKIRAQKGNTIILHKGAVMRKTAFKIRGTNNIVEIGEDASIIQGEFCIEDSGNVISVGKRTSMCGKIHLACTEGKKISIGDDCLFSSDIVFRTGDSHFITDANTGERINPGKDIVVENHVWFGHRVMVNKGVVIPEDTVVGTGAIVTKSFDEKNTIIAGVPAKVVKREINWGTDRF